jgi:hypothetical protein
VKPKTRGIEIGIPHALQTVSVPVFMEREGAILKIENSPAPMDTVCRHMPPPRQLHARVAERLLALEVLTQNTLILPPDVP